jgi:hypothetical protein
MPPTAKSASRPGLHPARLRRGDANFDARRDRRDRALGCGGWSRASRADLRFPERTNDELNTSAALLRRCSSTDDLERDGVRLLLAHVVGQVRDVLATAREGKLDAGLFTDLAAALKSASA